MAEGGRRHSAESVWNPSRNRRGQCLHDIPLCTKRGPAPIL